MHDISVVVEDSDSGERCAIALIERMEIRGIISTSLRVLRFSFRSIVNENRLSNR